MRHFILILSGLLAVLSATVRVSGQSAENRWVDSVYNSLTPAERIAQLMVIRAYSWKDSVYNDSLANAVRTHRVGGVCFFKGSPVRQARLTNRLQSEARTPLLVAIDAEWGMGMRLDSAFSFPRQMTLGALSDDSLIGEMGRLIAKDCHRLGIQVNFAPVADVNNNPLNPVIHLRSFGENPDQVARKSLMYMKGMQDEGIITTAKHFPGHGDTDTDSHLALPVINHPMERLDSVELLPFRKLIEAGVQGVMIGHLFLPGLDSSVNTPTTLSHPVVTGLLREKLGFRGYIVTDALDMKGVTKFFKPGEIELQALRAGNDILLLPQDAGPAIRVIQAAVDSGSLPDTLIEYRCKRMLRLKYRAGLSHREPVRTGNLVNDLNSAGHELLLRRMVRQSLTLVADGLRTIPLRATDHRTYAVLTLGDTARSLFASTLGRYIPLQEVCLGKRFTRPAADSILKRLFPADLVVVGVHGLTSQPADTFGLTRDMLFLLDTLMRVNRTVITLFGTPYALGKIPGPGRAESVVVAYQDNAVTREAAAVALCGGEPFEGTLPVSAGGYRSGTGETTWKSRLSPVMPEEIGLPSASLEVIDSILLRGLSESAYPGCQVLLAKDGRIFYDKSFGHAAYGDSLPVTDDYIYDVASVTKVATTTLALMKLTEEGKIRLSDSLGRYLPLLRGTNKGRLLVADVLAHQAGLQDWISFYPATLREGKPDTTLYRNSPSADFPVRVAENLYLRRDYPDTLVRRLLTSPVKQAGEYKYSDLGFYLLKMLVEEVSGMTLDRYAAVSFYKPLGLSRTGFLPRAWYDPSLIAPTENDTVFRMQPLRGDVHDPGAAMLGGVSGHAGLFSNARDLAVILELLMRKGNYGEKQYFSPATVEQFTRTAFPEKGNRRGLGFDKPPRGNDRNGPVCLSASPQSFGHSGFTGTYVWADPANGLTYVFLSNRVCPDAGNHKLADMNIRTGVHQAVYDLFKRYRVK